MTTASELLRNGGAGGPFLTDPRDMDRHLVNGLYFWDRPGGTGTPAIGYFGTSGGATQSVSFWTDFMPRLGAAVVSSAWVADTYKTVLDVSGRGLIYNIISPYLAPTQTHGLRITLDGLVWEILETVPQTNSNRIVLGAIGDFNQAADPVAEKNDTMAGFSANAFPVTAKGFVQDQSGYMLSANEIYGLNQVLKFSQSCKIEMKTSVAVAASGSDRFYSAGVRYRLAN